MNVDVACVYILVSWLRGGSKDSYTYIHKPRNTGQ